VSVHGRPFSDPTHYIIEGERFHTTAEVYRAAVTHGFDGDLDSMGKRLRSNRPYTWAALAAPIDKRRASQMRATRTKTRDEAVAAAAAVDERRARIMAAQSAETQTEED
jgi:hypothetical protein